MGAQLVAGSAFEAWCAGGSTQFSAVVGSAVPPLGAGRTPESAALTC